MAKLTCRLLKAYLGIFIAIFVLLTSGNPHIPYSKIRGQICIFLIWYFEKSMRNPSISRVFCKIILLRYLFYLYLKTWSVDPQVDVVAIFWFHIRLQKVSEISLDGFELFLVFGKNRVSVKQISIALGVHLKKIASRVKT